MLSVKLKLVLVILLMQNSCCPFDFILAKRLLIESTHLLSPQSRQCEQTSASPATFINLDEQISC